MNRTSCRSSTSPVDIRELGVIDYRAAWAIQRELAEARAEEDTADTLLLLEHPEVYTAGRRTEEHEKPVNGAPVIDVDRGGKITYHAPGQLVGYPIVKLADPIDVVDYVRRIEQGLIAMCDELGLAGTGRVEGRSGVWLPANDTQPERKVCAIGVRVQRGVTLHGFAVNCDCDLAGFDAVVPCGITDAGVASLSVELGRRVTVAEVRPLAQRCVLDALDGTIPLSVRDIPRVHPPQAPGLRRVLSSS